MAIPRTIRRLNRRQSQLRRDQLRKEQLLREQHRKELRSKTERRKQRVDGVKAAMVLMMILAFFALVYWLAISDSLPTAY